MKRVLQMLAAGLLLGSASLTWAAAPKNIIIFIGDGMGSEQVKAASLYAFGQEGMLEFERLPFHGWSSTRSADDPVTDSAAGGTAIATGRKVNNGVISMALPGDGQELPTLLEIFKQQDKAVGLVSTATITHATPASFGAHEPSRKNESEIAQDYMKQTRPNVLLGGGGRGMSPEAAEAADYTVVTDRQGMQSLDTESIDMVSGQFGTDQMPYEYDYRTGLNDSYDTLPHLSEMTRTALQILDNDEDGFFLMVEGGRIDHAGHGGSHFKNVEHRTGANIYETLEFSRAVGEALEWAEGRNDTLIIVTADHETGGLSVVNSRGAGQLPEVTWAHGSHTGVDVPIYAWGPGADVFAANLDNTAIFSLVMAAMNQKDTPAQAAQAAEAMP